MKLSRFPQPPGASKVPVAMPAEADEAEESEKPSRRRERQGDGSNITRGIELGRLG